MLSDTRHTSDVADGLQAFIRKLSRRDDLNAEELKALQTLRGRVRSVPANDDIVSPDQTIEQSCLLLSGFCGRYSPFRDGIRQFTEINIPGDFIDLHGFVLKQLDHGVMAFSACRVLEVSHSDLRGVTENFAHLTRLLWLETVVDAAVHRQWLVSIARQQGPARLARLLCELYVRLASVELAADLRMDLPMTQQQVGEVLGFSAVHVNRTIQTLRERQLLTWRDREIEILDWMGLTALGDFDPGYLRLYKKAV